jgi:hypothetical protein
MGIGLTGADSVTIGLSPPPGAMPVRIDGGGFGGIVGAYVTSATFSGGSYTEVRGTVAVAGQAMGDPLTPSTIVKNHFNSNATLLDFGSLALNGMKIANLLINCNTVFGGTQ